MKKNKPLHKEIAVEPYKLEIEKLKRINKDIIKQLDILQDYLDNNYIEDILGNK